MINLHTYGFAKLICTLLILYIMALLKQTVLNSIFCILIYQLI